MTCSTSLCTPPPTTLLTVRGVIHSPQHANSTLHPWPRPLRMFTSVIKMDRGKMRCNSATEWWWKAGGWGRWFVVAGLSSVVNHTPVHYQGGWPSSCTWHLLIYMLWMRLVLAALCWWCTWWGYNTRFLPVTLGFDCDSWLTHVLSSLGSYKLWNSGRIRCLTLPYFKHDSVVFTPITILNHVYKTLHKSFICIFKRKKTCNSFRSNNLKFIQVWNDTIFFVIQLLKLR